MTESEWERLISVTMPQAGDGTSPGGVHGAINPSSQFQTEMAVRLNAAIEQLPPNMGAVLKTWMAGKTLGQIAAELELHEHVVWKRIERARTRVLEILSKAGPAPHASQDSEPATEEANPPFPAGTMGSEEFLAWARETVDEAEIVAGLKEVRETGGLGLADFIGEIEQEATPRE
jgi:hypothetical protein